jgi:hypothetical protein
MVDREAMHIAAAPTATATPGNIFIRNLTPRMRFESRLLLFPAEPNHCHRAPSTTLASCSLHCPETGRANLTQSSDGFDTEFAPHHRITLTRANAKSSVFAQWHGNRLAVLMAARRWH